MRVTIDLMKKSTQIIDLSNVINPRVGDDDLQLPLHIGYGDNLFDMRGKDVEFLSNDPNKKNIYIAGTCNTNTPGDNLYMGDLTFRFPAGTFKADGTYDPDKTMFRIVDKETQKVISSVNVKITVMKNNIEFDFDPDKSSYDSRLETMLHDFHDKGQAMLDEIKGLNNQAKSNVSGDTATTAKEAKKQADQNAGDISDIQGEVAGARGRFANMADREDAQDAAINQKENIANANTNYALLQQKDTQQDIIIATKARQDFIIDYLSQMHLQPEAFENEATLKTKYPNGKSGLMVTGDTGHKWLWIQGAWKDCGIYQSAGIAAGIKYDKLDDTLKGAFLPNVEEIPVVGNHPGYISKQDGKVVPTNNYYHSDALSVMPGEEYRIKGRTYYDGRTVILENGDGKIVQTYPNDSADQEVTFGFTVPQGASRMIINYNSFTPTRVLKILNYNRNAAWANLNQITFTQKADTYIPIKLEENLEKGYWDYKREGAFSVNKDSSASYKPIAVKPFEVYRVTGQSKYDAKLATLIDYDGNMIQAVPNSDDQAGIFNIVIPWNAAFILINNYTGIATKLEKATSFSNPMEDTQNRLNKALLNFKKSNYDFEGIQLSYTQQGFWDRNGRFTESNYIDSTDKIPVSSFDVYRIKGYTYFDSNLYELLDANGSIVDIYPNTSEDLKKYENTFIIPDNAQFLVINHYKGYDVTLEKATNLSKSVLSTTGKKWIAIGDSWTAVGTLGNGIDNYTNYVAKRLGLNMDNAAIGGTGYVAHNKNANDQFYNREIAADGDAYTILGSFNDVFVDGFKFGDVGNTDKLSLWGGMKATIDHIYSVKDNARIGIIAPGPWGAFNPQNGSNWDKLSMKASEVGEQYVATMKKFADCYSLPFLDLYHQSNLRPWDSDYVKKYFHGDNTHPNTEGHKQFAPIIADFVNWLL